MIGLTVALLPTCAAAQKQPQPISKNQAPTAEKTPKLTERQQRGLKLLQSAEDEAGSTTPETQAYVLWQVAGGYEQIGRRSAMIPLLKRSFDATLALDCPPPPETDIHNLACIARGDLQGHILRRLVDLSIPATADLLPRAEPSLQDELSGAIISDYIRRKDYDRARGMIDELGRDGRFPYQSAVDFITALPEELSAEKVQVFAEALNNFKQNGPSQRPDLVDFGTMVARFWQTMPKPMVAEAIDSLLSQAKDSDQSSETKRRIVLGTTRGEVYFNSNYEFRLFQLLPILQQIDPERAESMMREQQQLKAALQQYPNGLQSADSMWDGQAQTDKPQVLSMNYIDPNDTNAAAREAKMRSYQELRRKEMEVEVAARDDGDKGLEAALALPEWDSEQHRSSPRAHALLQVARITAKRQPQVSTRALEKMQGLLSHLSSDETQWLVEKARFLRVAATVYHRLGDDDAAFSALKQGFKTADELFARDTDSDDPNLAPKIQWPSTVTRIHLFQTASEISPRMAEDLLQDTSDPDQRVIHKVALGRSLLGSYTPPFDVTDWRKAGFRFSIEAPN